MQCSSAVSEVATHGGEALSYMREHPPPALILMEVMMPGPIGRQKK